MDKKPYLNSKTKNIVLINPPVPENKSWVREGRCQQWDIWGAPFPPLSLGLISTRLIRSGYSTCIIDSSPEKLNIDDVICKCRRFSSDAAIIATATPTLSTDLSWFILRLKKYFPELPIAAIGVHVSTMPENVLKKYPALDYIIVGEPEVTAGELIHTLFSKDRPLDSVKGIAFRNQKKEIVVTQPRGFIKDVDSLGFPDWENINFANYRLPILDRPFSLVTFARGCPFKCKYCATQAYYGNRLRLRSPNSIISEIKYCISKGVNDYLLWTEQLTFDKVYVNRFLDRLFAENLHKKIHWVCNSRVDQADGTLFHRMKQAGCWQIAFGFEFGDNKILELAEKGGKASVEQGTIAADLAAKAGLVVDGHFIMGYPGETVNTLQKTIDYACSLPITFAHFYPAAPFPDSELYKEAIEKGWLSSDNLKQVNQEIPSIETEELSREQVNAYIEKAYKRFYFRKETIWRIVRIPGSLREYFNLIKIGFRFLWFQFIKRKKLRKYDEF